MKTGVILLPMAAVMAICTAVCAWPASFWIVAKPNYWFAGFGVVVMLAFVGMWLIFCWNEAAFDDAIERTAFANNHLTETERADATETDWQYEQNSGVVQWANNDAGQVQRARYQRFRKFQKETWDAYMREYPPTEAKKDAVRRVRAPNGPF